jgi:hypothetical protein
MTFGQYTEATKRSYLLTACLFRLVLLTVLLFNSEDGGDMFLRNFGSLPVDYMTLYPTR